MPFWHIVFIRLLCGGPGGFKAQGQPGALPVRPSARISLQALIELAGETFVTVELAKCVMSSNKTCYLFVITDIVVEYNFYIVPGIF